MEAEKIYRDCVAERGGKKRKKKAGVALDMTLVIVAFLKSQANSGDF